MAARKRASPKLEPVKVFAGPLSDGLMKLLMSGSDTVTVPRATMDGMFLVCNMLLGALRRGAHVSLGLNEDSTDKDRAEVRALMVKLAAAGLSDVLESGMLDLDSIREFAGDVQDIWVKERKR